ncbi:phage tail assembly chaperone [Comamonas sp.]|uniref:phage tail assembly chaperone n=1 Tax=Comamonas sp. TaxID=34028 RepID=UPI00289E3BC0|nr:phage tail assembly chaperone [Comamonas sp.]
MAKSLASFAPTPTFKGTADVPVAGKGPQPLGLTFRFHDTEAMKALSAEFTALQDKYKATAEAPLSDEQEKDMRTDQAKLVMKIVSAWEFTDEFSVENITQFFVTHAFAFSAIVTGFFQAHSGAKTKN